MGRASGELADGDSGDSADGVTVVCRVFGLSPTVCATRLTIAHRRSVSSSKFSIFILNEPYSLNQVLIFPEQHIINAFTLNTLKLEVAV